MVTASISEKIIDFKKDLFSDHLYNFVKPPLENFEKILKSYDKFNLFFCSFIFTEILYLFFHLTFLIQTFVLAINLALIFATVFSYFTLRLYFQTQKTERFFELKAALIQQVKSHFNSQSAPQESHIAVANVCCKLAADLHGKEYSLYSCPSWLHFFSLPLERFSSWCHWQDIHDMKEILLQTSVKEHIQLVQLEPTNLEVHVGLANAYVMLSGLYVDPKTVEGMNEDRWIPENKYNEKFKEKFRCAAERAIEEFKILSDYAPNDPWVHTQLAFSYRDLQMPKEEIKEYETILNLCPDDKETLYKLGKLYFEQGWNAKGLQVFESLKNSNYKKAESLIQFYGIAIDGII